MIRSQTSRPDSRLFGCRETSFNDSCLDGGRGSGYHLWQDSLKRIHFKTTSLLGRINNQVILSLAAYSYRSLFLRGHFLDFPVPKPQLQEFEGLLWEGMIFISYPLDCRLMVSSWSLSKENDPTAMVWLLWAFLIPETAVSRKKTGEVPKEGSWRQSQLSGEVPTCQAHNIRHALS